MLIEPWPSRMHVKLNVNRHQLLLTKFCINWKCSVLNWVCLCMCVCLSVRMRYICISSIVYHSTEYKRIFMVEISTQELFSFFCCCASKRDFISCDKNIWSYGNAVYCIPSQWRIHVRFLHISLSLKIKNRIDKINE